MPALSHVPVPVRHVARTLPVLAALLFLLALAAPAFAHTGLESSDPAADAEVDAGLQTVTLTYGAPIRLLEDTLVARSADGRTVAATESVDADGLVVTAELDEPLDGGSWSLAWRVLATDSHPRTGEVPITIASADPSDEPSEQQGSSSQGEPSAPADSNEATSQESATAAPAAAPQEPGAGLERAGAVARILFYVGLLVAAGLALFKAGPHAGMSERARRLAGISLVAALLALVSGVAEVALHVAAVSGRGLVGLFDMGTWRAVLGTGLGPALLLRTVGLGLLAFGARRRVRDRLASGPDWRKLLGALVAIGSFQFVGHTASAAPPVVVRSADLVHAVAAAIWVGGLVGLVVTARPSDPRDRSVTVARFSTWATVAVAGVTTAGIALAWVNLPTIAAAWQTGYGRLLLGKLVLVGILLLMGAHNHFNVVPDVTAGNAAAAAELRQIVRWELVVVGVVVVLTALLVNTSPL